MKAIEVLSIVMFDTLVEYLIYIRGVTSRKTDKTSRSEFLTTKRRNKKNTYYKLSEFRRTYI